MRGKWSVSKGAWARAGALTALLAVAEPAAARDFELVTTLDHPNPRDPEEDRFGSGLAFSAGTLFVGARDEKAANDYSGVVHVFSDASWAEVAELTSSDDTDFEFGAVIQLDGDRAVISNASIDGGVVWFFEKSGDTWTEKLRVQGAVNEAFGYRLALRGDYAFIAAPRVGAGSVHVYRRVGGTWGEVQVLTASDAQDEDFFGYSLAFDGERLAIGAPGNFLGPTRCGAYTFSKVGDLFVEDRKLTGDAPTTHWFGSAVGVSGDTLIVNAPPVYQATAAGKAVVYERQGDDWKPRGELTADEEQSFPVGIAFDGDRLWIDGRTNDAHSASIYAFERTNGDWHQAQRLNFPDLGEYEIASWAFHDDTLTVGFWNGLRSESVRVYRPADYVGSGGDTSVGGGAGASAAGKAGSMGGPSEGGASGEGAAAAGVGSNPPPSAGGSGGSAGTATQGGASGSGSSAGGSNAGGSGEPPKPGDGAPDGGTSDARTSEHSGCSCSVGSTTHEGSLVALVAFLTLARRQRSRNRGLWIREATCSGKETTQARW